VQDFDRSKKSFLQLVQKLTRPTCSLLKNVVRVSVVAGAPAWRAVVLEESERPRLQPSPRDDPPAHLQTPAEVHTLCGQSSPLLLCFIPNQNLLWHINAQVSVYFKYL